MSSYVSLEPRKTNFCMQSKTLTVELLSYNAELHVLGYIMGAFQWLPNGLIVAVFTYTGMPALDYLTLDDTAYSAFSQVHSCMARVLKTDGGGRGQ